MQPEQHHFLLRRIKKLYTLAPKISTPFTSNEMPMKNQMEMLRHIS